MADTEHTTPPIVMGPEEAKRWHDFDVDRRNGVSTVPSLRHVTGARFMPGRPSDRPRPKLLRRVMCGDLAAGAGL